jgi:hypothetical protein
MGGTGGSSASVFSARKTHWRASRQCHPLRFVAGIVAQAVIGIRD